MNRILQLQQDKTAAIESAQAILTKAAADNNRALTADERAAVTTHMDNAQSIVATLDIEQRAATLSNLHSDSRPTPAGRVEVRERILDKPFANIGEQMQAVMRAFHNPHATDTRLLALRDVGNDPETRAASGLSEAVPSDGGFLVQPELDSEILKRAYENGQVAQRCRKRPLTTSNSLKINGIDESSRANGSRHGGVRAYWQNEADALTSSAPKFRIIELVLKKLTALYYSTDELLADAPALTAEVNDALSDEFAFKLDDAVIRGTGSGQPYGILNAPAVVSVAKETGQAAATVVPQNIENMWARMWGRSRLNAVWFINQDVEPSLNLMSLPVGTGGVPVYMPNNSLSGSPYSTLKGRPVIPIEQCDTLGTVGDIILADFSQYVMAERGGLQSAMSMHVRFLNDELVFRFILRVDGQPTWHKVLTPYKGSNTYAPFVTLATRA